MPTRGNPTLHQNNYWSSYIGATVIVPVDGTVRHNASVLAPGRYSLFCRESALYVRQGGAGSSVTANDFVLEKATYLDLTVDDVYNGFVFVSTADGLAGSLRVTTLSGTTGSPSLHQNDFWTSYVGNTQSFAFGGSDAAARTTLLAPGHYFVYCREAALYLLQGGSSVVANSSQFLLERGTYRDLTVDDATTGYLSYLTVDALAGKLRITNAHDET